MFLGSHVSAVDPYIQTEFVSAGAGPGYQNRDGLTISTPRLTAGENTGVFVVAGQSNSASYGTGPYTITNTTKLDMVDPYNGGTYRMVEPVLGCNVGTSPDNTNLFVRCFDTMITAGIFQRIIACYIGVNGSPISHWDTGGDCNQKLLVASRRLASVGLTISGFLWLQGESDAGIAQATYAAALARVIGTPRAEGYNAPWFIGKASYLGGVVDANVQAAQVAAVNNTTIFAGGDTDTLTGTAVNRQVANNTHFKSAGADAAAALWKTALDAVF